MTQQAQNHSALLTAGKDPQPVTVVNQHSTSPLLLVCEHAGRYIPKSLDNLGLSTEQRAAHIAYDIGAERVALGLAERFGCRLILQNYSRLVIDCNRRLNEPSSIPRISDTTPVPGNKNLGPGDIKQRQDEIFHPFAQRCQAEIARSEITHTFSIHSFTPQMSGGQPRPWDIGFLYRRAHSQGRRLSHLCASRWPGLTVGQNQPYSIDDTTDWFIPVCAEPRKIPHSLIEIRNDHIRTAQSCDEWAGRLVQLMSEFMEQPDAHHP